MTQIIHFSEQEYKQPVNADTPSALQLVSLKCAIIHKHKQK